MRVPVAKRTIVIVVAICGFLGIAAGYLAPRARHVKPNIVSLTPEQEYGRSLYNGYCAACHETRPDWMKVIPPNIHGIHGSGRLPSGAPATDEYILNFVKTGKFPMPAFGKTLTDAQIESMIVYLRKGEH